MQFSEFLAQVRRQLEEEVEGVWKDASLLYWTNEAANDFARKAKVSQDEAYTTTVIGQSQYSLPDYTLEVIGMFFDGKPLRRIGYGGIPNIAAASGTPVGYLITDDEVILYPAPDSEAQLTFYRYRLPDPITDTSSMPFRSEWNTALEYAVLNRAFQQIGSWNDAQSYYQLYQEQVTTAISQEAIERQAGKSTAPVEVY